MNAINVVKSKGGLTKSNPNQVKLDPEKRKSRKLATEGDIKGDYFLTENFQDQCHRYGRRAVCD